MPAKVYTIETRLSAPIGSELREYLDEYVTEYNKCYRDMWHHMTAPDFKTRYSKESNFVTDMCNKYGYLKRTVNSIRYDIKGRMKSYKELKKTELRQLETKIQIRQNKIEQIIEKLDKLKSIVTNNKATDKQLIKYRQLKQSLYFQKNKLNKMLQSKNKLEYQIENNIYSIGFGGKRTFDNQNRLQENGYKTHIKWYNDYVKSRDKNIFYLGSSDESFGNQMFQMAYNTTTDDFNVKLRKENKWCKSTKEIDKYIIADHIDFKYMKEYVKEIVLSYCSKESTKKLPLSYRFHRRGTHWYLQVMFSIEYDTYETFSKYGTIGLDYNDGFIELSETDECGNLIYQEHIVLKEHGTGNKAKSEIEQSIAKIVSYALLKGKDIVIEDLNFKKKKSFTAKGDKNKKYNKMIHLFDYSRYKDTMEKCCHRNKVNLIKINPYMTTQIGKQKYSSNKKLSTHQAASYVIARRGQGFKDKYVKAA